MERGRTELSGDVREIMSVEKGTGESSSYYKVGKYYNGNIISKIIPYDELGQSAYVPWIAIYVGDEIITRMDAFDCQVCYKPEA